MISSNLKLKRTLPLLFFLSLSLISSTYGNAYNQRNAFMVDTTKIYNQTTNWQSNAKVAFDGTNFLVVWLDLRKDGYSQIRGCRVNQNGQILDKGGFTISLAEPYEYGPNVIFDGIDYFIAWISRNPKWSQYDVKAARISVGGIVLDSSAIVVADFTSSKRGNPVVASCGTNILTVWTYSAGTQSGVYGARVSPQGVVLDPTPILISGNYHHPFHPSAAFDGANYMVIWQDSYSPSWDTCYKYIRGARISTAGTLIDTIPITFFSYESGSHFPDIEHIKLNPCLCFGANNYMLLWNFVDFLGDYNENIYGLRISPAGTVLDANNIPVSCVSGNQISPSLAFDGSEFLAVWQDFRNDENSYKPLIYFTKIDTSGTVLDSVGSSLLQNSIETLKQPSICYGAGEYVIPLIDRRGNPFKYAIDDDISIVRVDIAGNPIDSSGIPLSISTQHQRNPAVGFDGLNHLVVWEDERDSDNDLDLYGALIDTTGNMLNPPGVFAVSQAKYKQTKPVVDFVEPYYLVVWQDYRKADWIPRLYGARIKKDGTVLEPNGIDFNISDSLLKQCQNISNDSTNFLLVWQKTTMHASALYYKVFAARIDTSGTIIDPGGILIDSLGCYPDVSFDGENWFVCYRSNNFAGIRLSSSGIIIPPVIEISNGYYYFTGEPPLVTFNGTNYLVAWGSIDDYFPTDENIHGSRVSPSGYDLDSVDIHITQALLSQYAPQMASCGGNFFLSWVDTRNNIDTLTDYIKSIYGTYISPEGIVLDTNGIQFTPTFSESNSPAVVRSSGNKFLLCYSGFTESPYGSYRIYAQLVDALVGTEEQKNPSVLINKLEQNSPNPFTKSTEISFQIREKCLTELAIFNAAGQRIKTIIKQTKKPGFYTVRWNGKDTKGRIVSSGVYFYKIKMKNFTMTRKILFIQ